MENSRFMNVAEVAADFRVSESKAYMLIKEMNNELKKKGYITVAGRVSRKYYLERTYGSDVDSDYQEENTAQEGA